MKAKEREFSVALLVNIILQTWIWDVLNKVVGNYKNPQTFNVTSPLIGLNCR